MFHLTLVCFGAWKTGRGPSGAEVHRAPPQVRPGAAQWPVLYYFLYTVLNLPMKRALRRLQIQLKYVKVKQ